MRDLDVRIALRRELSRQHAGDDRTLIVEEMGVWSGSVRVDIAVVNGELQGFEIKSAKDTLSRLCAQEALYSQVFDRVTLVIGDKHLQKAMALVPTWWGITIATSDDNNTVSLSSYRASETNPALNALQVARLMWRDEMIDILERHSLLRGLKSANVEKLRHKAIEALAPDLLRLEVRETLKRRSWSRKPADDKGKVAIGVDLDPLRSTAGADVGIRSYRTDPLICPTVR